MSLVSVTIRADKPLSHDIAAKHNYTAVLKTNRHKVEIFMNRQTRHLQEATSCYNKTMFSKTSQ